jgi:protein phosphatase
LEELGYEVSVQPEEADGHGYRVRHPQGRKAIFLGDLVDRGPNAPEVLRLVMSMVETGTALCLPGNHDVKLLRALQGKNVRASHGLAETLAQLEGESAEFKEQVAKFITCSMRGVWWWPMQG